MIALRIAPYISSNGVRLAKSAPGNIQKNSQKDTFGAFIQCFYPVRMYLATEFWEFVGAVGRERRAAMETKYTAPNLRMPSRAELKANQKYKNKIK